MISGGVCVFTMHGGRVLANKSESTMSVRYEDLIINTYDVLKNILDFLRLELSEEQLQHGIHGAS